MLYRPRSGLLLAAWTLLMTLWPGAGLRAEPMPMLAVLELETSDKEGSGEELIILTDALRGAVVQSLGERFKVLTRETMTELVPPERMSCFVDKCAAEVGRMLQASHVVAGTVRRLGTRLVLTVEAYESTSGRLLGSQQFFAGTMEEMVGSVADRVPSLTLKWFASGGTPAPAPVPVAPPPSVQPQPAKSAEIVPPAESLPATPSDTAVRPPQWAVRAGLDLAGGFLGASVEWKPGLVGFVLGTGQLPISAGITLSDPKNRGGAYLDLKAALMADWLGVARYTEWSTGWAISPVGLVGGATAGWDWRFGGWSLRTGVGVAASNLGFQNRSPWLVDLSFGRVF